MIEISSIDLWDEDIHSSFATSERSPSWELAGRITLASGLIFSAPSFFGSFQAKKRIAIRLTAEGEAVFVSISNPEPAAPSESPQTSRHLYEKLHCTPNDQKIIGTIINTVAEGGVDLLWKKQYLDDLGEQILPVHPYKFLSTILLDPHLRKQLKVIFDDPLFFKRHGFLGGVKQGMEREAANLETHIKEFAAEMGTRPEALRPFIQKGDWHGLVTHLLRTNPRLKS